MKVYSGAPAAARNYVEADRRRVDDYYLAEGAGVARRFSATEGRVTELAPLTGEAYETWVAGRDPATGQPRGRLRNDGHAVRFVEVVVNGPKSWSIAAALHSDIAHAYQAAQDRAAEQIIGWLSEHATTRVGPRGGQAAVSLEVLESATVRHYTSRAGDPHWHLHLQVLSRVFAAGKWRGLWTVDVRDSLAAINGIGHAAMDTDPELNAALSANGYTKDNGGELTQLAEYVGPFSARQGQIARNIDRYEREWTSVHPGEAPGPALRRSWDARAWAEGRPDKVTPRSGADLGERWRAELHELGFRAPTRPVRLTPIPVGALDREQLVERALTRLAAGRSAWNAADVRGEVERLIAGQGVVIEAAVRIELAEDLTARAMGRCVPLLDRDGVPEHIRAWTSPPVLAVEADLVAQLAARTAEPSLGSPDDALTPAPTHPTPALRLGLDLTRLDPGQAAAVVALAGDRRLVVVEGAAGAGKTTTLAATRGALEQQDRRLVVVTPSLKAAKVAQAEVGAAAGSAARLAYEYGWRWDDDGRWTRLAVGEIDSASGRLYAGPRERARLRPGDLLVVDEAGMLDQDTARALLTVAEECQVRVALFGDRHQLAAVGRGGVLDLAVGQVDADAYLTLEGLHRFIRTVPGGRAVPDVGYADLTVAMRTGDDPGKVFDALFTAGRIRLYPDPDALRDALADSAASSYGRGERIAVVVDTREQVAVLNAAIRDRLVADALVDDTGGVTTRAGERIGIGDRIVTRCNDHHLDVANRDVWLVAGVGAKGELLVIPAASVDAPVTAGCVSPGPEGHRVLPAHYVTDHVELAYATTAHGAQGDTVTAAHLVVAEHTGAASAYVGMTRGRQANTAHLVAADIDQARDQWMAVFARDRADRGPAHAARLAAATAAEYRPPRPVEQVLAELSQTREAEQRCLRDIPYLHMRCRALAELVALGPGPGARLPQLQAQHQQALHAAGQARLRAEASAAVVAADAATIRDGLLRAWDSQRGGASAAAQIVQQGPGRFGRHRFAVTEATAELIRWADTWQTYLPDLPTDPQRITRVAARFDDRPALWRSFDAAAQRTAEQAHPEHTTLAARAEAARAAAEVAARALQEARREDLERSARFGNLARTPDPVSRLAQIEADLTATHEQLAAARTRIAALQAEPTHRARATDQPAGRRALGQIDRYDHGPATAEPPAPDRRRSQPRPEDLQRLQHRPRPGRGVSR